MLKHFNKIFAGLSLLILTLLISACGNSDNHTANAGSNGIKTITITMIGNSANDPVSLSAKLGAEEHAEKLNNKYQKLNVVIDWKAPESENAAAQAKLLMDAAQHGTDAIIVSCSNSESLNTEINEAEKSGITVITMDRDAPNSNRSAYYGADNFEMGQTIIRKLATLTKEKGQIAILAGNMNAYNQQERIRGILETLEEYPEIVLVKTAFHDETPEGAYDAMVKIQTLYPGLSGWIMLGNWVFYNEKYSPADQPENIKIVTVDAFPVQFPQIENGNIQYCIGQPVFKLGGGAVELVINKIYLEKEINEINTLAIIPVSIDNLGGWSRQFRAWGQEGIDKKYLLM